MKGVRPQTRETAHEAARRSGMSVGQWLDSVIIDSAADEGVPVPPPVYTDIERDGDAPAGAVTAVRQCLNELSAQIDRLAHSMTVPQPVADSSDDSASPDIAESIARLDRRMERLIDESRAATSVLERKVSAVDDSLSALWHGQTLTPPGAAGEVEAAAEEFAARQRELDAEAGGDGSTPSSGALAADRRFSGLEQHLRDIGDRIEAIAQAPGLEQQLNDIRARVEALDKTPGLERQLSAIGERIAALGQPSDLEHQFNDIRARVDALQSPGLEQQLQEISRRLDVLGDSSAFDDAIAAVRRDLAEIAHALADATPRHAIEALENEVRTLAARVDAGRSAGVDPSMLAGFEQGLAEVREALENLAPSESLAGVEAELKALAQKVDLVASGAGDPAALQQLETAISTLREVISHVASNDALASLTAEVRALGDKVNLALSATGRSNDLLLTLETRIASIADALESMRAESAHAEPADIDTVMSEIGRKIEHLQEARADGGAGSQLAAGQIEQHIARLIDRLDASEARLVHLNALESKVAELIAHLDHANANAAAAPDGATRERLAAVDALERDVAQLRQTQTTAGRRTLDSLEIVQSTIGNVVERLAAIESGMRDGASQRSASPAASAPPPPTIAIKASDSTAVAVSATAAAATAKVAAAPSVASAAQSLDTYLIDASGKISFPPTRPVAAPPLAPIDPTLPPDHPLEPGSGTPRPSGATPAERIAASKAVLESAKVATAAAPGSKSNFILAARRAAQAAAEQRTGGAATIAEIKAAAPALRGGLFRRHAKSLLVGVSVIVIIVGALHAAATLLKGRDSGEGPKPQSSRIISVPQGDAQTADGAAASTGSIVAPAIVQSTPSTLSDEPARGAGVLHADNDPLGFAPSSGTLGVARSAEPPDLPVGPPVAPASGEPVFAPGKDSAGVLPVEVTGAVEPATPPAAPVAPPQANAPAPAPKASSAPPASVAPPLSVVPPAVAPPPAPMPAAVSAPPAATPSSALVPPAGIGSKELVAAAAKGDPAAAYEIATRLADGRGVTANPEDAALWFERAANAGLAPAQFRLGGMYEKGIGVKRDVQRARQLYLAAAGKGNSKAMHNLAVLYAEGVDGKPDYETAAQWFRKGAAFGVADSQFNLGVLYARGIGVEQNLSESFKWFALAAQQGDQDAAKKRDEIAKRLDPQALNAARHAVQSWTSELQPDEAVAVKTPPGGWDHTATGSVSARPKGKSRRQ